MRISTGYILTERQLLVVDLKKGKYISPKIDGTLLKAFVIGHGAICAP
jgi:hypothetical protein